MMEDSEYYAQMKDIYASLKNYTNKKDDSKKKLSNDLESNELNRFKMTIAVRKDLNMSTGKIAAQVGHGVLDCYKNALKLVPDYVKIWENNSGCAKIVLQVNSLKEVQEIRDIAIKEGVPYSIIADAGRTEVEPGTITVIAFGPGPSNLIDKITGKLDLFK